MIPAVVPPLEATLDVRHILIRSLEYLERIALTRSGDRELDPSIPITLARVRPIASYFVRGNERAPVIMHLVFTAEQKRTRVIDERRYLARTLQTDHAFFPPVACLDM